MNDYSELKRLAEAFPADLDWDGNAEPFFNGPSGESLGGGPTGFYSVFGQPFEIEEEMHDGHEYVSVCTKEFAEFLCSARAGVLVLIAENEKLTAHMALRKRRIDSDNECLGAAASRIDDLEAEVEAIRKERDKLANDILSLMEDPGSVL